ncbi:MAG: hypothetical protein HYW24_01640 [Candidatus Aenigmarchaeota archaeon]|nr:hypothetical protein [Candidatus Aenigmarchaeota archaeon]
METLLDEIRNHLDLKKNTRENLNPNFFTEMGFTERELTDKERSVLKVDDVFVNSWNKMIGDDEITVVHHVKKEDDLIIPRPSEVHVHLITRNTKTNEEKREKYKWDERLSPIMREELL